MMADPAPADRQALNQKQRELWKSSLFRWLIFVQLLALFGYAYWWLGSELLTQTNTADKQMFAHDQMHNMRLATQTRADLHPNLRKGFLEPLRDMLPHRTDGVVQPLWPWLMAWKVPAGQEITEEDMQNKVSTLQDRALFDYGRWVNVFLTLGFLLMVGIGACRIFSFPAALNLILLGGFGAFLPRAAYFQPEPIYYIFLFLTWVACVSALYHNSLWIYALIGILSGVGYLAKASIQPLLAVFVVISSLRCIWEYWSARRRGLSLGGAHLWHWRNHLVGVVFLGGGFLLTASPRLSDAYEKFGDPFHSYPSYWMWMDNFEKEGLPWMQAHSNREQLQLLRSDERPSLSKYLRTHTHEEFITRLWTGTKSRVSEFFWPKQSKRIKLRTRQEWHGILEWRGLYLAWLGATVVGLLVVLLIAAPKPEHAGHVVFRHGSITVLLFIVGTCALYALSYGWYAPIAPGSGDRFMLSLYMPLVFSLIWGAETIVRRLRRRKSNPWIQRSYLIAQWILFAAITARLIEVIRAPHFYNG